MKKIIGFFKVLFHIKGIIEKINEDLRILSENDKLNWNDHSNYNANIMYLEKFTLSLRNKPIYDIGRKVYFNPKNNVEKPSEDDKLMGTITGIYTNALFNYDKAIISQVDYEYIYQIRRENQGVPLYYRVPESKIIM